MRRTIDCGRGRDASDSLDPLFGLSPLSAVVVGLEAVKFASEQDVVIAAAQQDACNVLYDRTG